MSKISSSGVKYRRENFKALKDEMANMKFELNKGGVLLNDKNEYIFRVQNRDSYFSRPSPEERYLFNEILKHYELSTNHLVQGFSNKYFSKLSDLMSSNKLSTNDYSKKRIALFNSRINENHKSYINYLKNKGGDVQLQSTINKKINPLNRTFTALLRNKIFNFKYHKNIKNNENVINNRIKLLSINRRYSSNPEYHSDFSPSSFEQYKKSINYRNENSLSTARDDTINSKHKIRQIISGNKSLSNNILDNKIDNKISNSIPAIDSKNQNCSDNNEEILEIIEKKSKDEFLSTYNKKNYMKFIKFKYHFVEDNFSQEKENKITIQDLKRRNMFKFKPKNRFLLKKSKDGDKFIFFKKIENENNKNNKSVIRIKRPFKVNKSSSFFSNNINNQSVI